MKRMRSEHENKISIITTSITGTEDEDSSSIWHILVLTLAPLYLLIIIGAITLSLIMLDRHAILLTNFVLQQAIFIVILIVGMTAAIIVYSLEVKHALRKIGMWRQNGQIKQANFGLLVLAIVGSIMILPIILALFFH